MSHHGFNIKKGVGGVSLPCPGAHGGTQGLGGGQIAGKIVVFECTGEDDAVLAMSALHRDVLVPFRSFDWLMMADDAARPRCVAASMQMVSIAPRMIVALTGSILAPVGRGGFRAARRVQFIGYR